VFDLVFELCVCQTPLKDGEAESKTLIVPYICILFARVMKKNRFLYSANPDQRQQLLGQAGQKGPLSHILSQKQYLNTLTAHWKPFDHAWFLYETPTAELYLSSKLHAENMNSPNKNWHAFCFDTVTHERLISAGSKQHLKSNLIHLCVKCVSVQSWEVQLIRTEEAEKFVAEI